MIHPPTKLKETGRFGMLGQKFNHLIEFVRSTRIVKSRTLDITHTINGTAIELKGNRDINVQKSSGGDSVWS